MRIRSDPIGGRLGLETANPALHAINLEAAPDYVLKRANLELPRDLDWNSWGILLDCNPTVVC